MKVYFIKIAFHDVSPMVWRSLLITYVMLIVVRGSSVANNVEVTLLAIEHGIVEIDRLEGNDTT